MRLAVLLVVVLLSGCAAPAPDTLPVGPPGGELVTPVTGAAIAKCLPDGSGNSMAPPWPITLAEPHEIAKRFDALAEVTVDFDSYQHRGELHSYKLNGDSWNPRLEIWYPRSEQPSWSHRFDTLVYQGPQLLDDRTFPDLMEALGFAAPNMEYGSPNNSDDLAFKQVVGENEIILATGTYSEGRDGARLSINWLYDLTDAEIKITPAQGVAAAQDFMSCAYPDKTPRSTGAWNVPWHSYQGHLVFAVGYQYEACEPDSRWDIFVDAVSGQVLNAKVDGACASFA